MAVKVYLELCTSVCNRYICFPLYYGISYQFYRLVEMFSAYWQHFCVSAIFLAFFPLCPILFELILSGGISEKSIAIFATLYIISCGVSSHNGVVFAISLFAGLIFSFISGLIANEIASGTEVFSIHFAPIAWVAIVLMLITHLIERYYIHIVNREPWKFFNFSR